MVGLQGSVLAFGAWGVWVRDRERGFRVEGLGFRGWDLGFRVEC